MTQPSFGVDSTQVAPIAKGMDRIGYDLGQIHATLQRFASGGDDVFAEYGASGAWSGFVSMWDTEIQVATWATQEWSESLRRAIDNYRHRDADTAQRFGSR